MKKIIQKLPNQNLLSINTDSLIQHKKNINKDSLQKNKRFQLNLQRMA